MSGAEIGDKRPSEFYRYLHAMAGSSDSISEQLVQQLWMRRLPHMVQAVLKGNLNLETQTLLTMADNIYEVTEQQRRSVFATSTPTQASTSDRKTQDCARLKRLEDEISELKKMFSRLNTNNQQRTRSRSRSRSQETEDDGWCWYHKKHGPKARKCNQPCSYTKTAKSLN